MLIADKYPQLEALKPQQTDGPLPDVQELRQQFLEAVSYGQDSVERGRFAIEHADYLNRTLDTSRGNPNAKIFFNSILVASHSAISDAYKEVILQLPPTHASALRADRFKHIFTSSKARKKIQLSVGESLRHRKHISARKHFNRVNGIAESAIAVVYGQSQPAPRFLRGIVTEHNVREAIAQNGIGDAWFSTVEEDVRGRVDVWAETQSVGRVALQVKSSQRPGLFMVDSVSPGELTIVVGQNPSSPYELTEQQHAGLRQSFEELAA